jgi:hypothetical protein
VLLLPVVVVVVCGEMWMIRVSGVLAVCGSDVYDGEMWLIRVSGVCAACGSDGCVW